MIRRFKRKEFLVQCSDLIIRHCELGRSAATSFTMDAISEGFPVSSWSFIS